ncbi:hypothetical protein [Rubrivirga sp.]|uniref:hypothetical protein n=1 Tax=Rubrivirga sp. TaxID=1885344 RepID=UPI003C71A2F3
MKPLALILLLVASGCVQTSALDLESAPLRSDINDRAALETTLVTLAWGETVRARLFHIAPDVATWLDPKTRRFRSVPASDVARVRFVHRGRGALEGGGLGLLVAGGLAAATYAAAVPGSDGWGTLAVYYVGVNTAPPLILGGAIVGGVAGSKRAYESPTYAALRPVRQPIGPALPPVRSPSVPSIQTDGLEYVARPTGPVEPRRGQRFPGRYAFTVVARYTNATADTVYLAPSRPSLAPVYQVRAVHSDPAAQAGSAYQPIARNENYGRYLPVAPGETRTDTLHLEGPQRDPRTGTVLGLMQGRMVVVYPASMCRSRDRSCWLPDTAVVSNPFDVRIE